jgi:hypothetical protein
MCVRPPPPPTQLVCVLRLLQHNACESSSSCRISQEHRRPEAKHAVADSRGKQAGRLASWQTRRKTAADLGEDSRGKHRRGRQRRVDVRKRSVDTALVSLGRAAGVA